MEPNTPLTYEDFKWKNLVHLARLLAVNHSLNWDHLSFPEKYYGFARQLFVKFFCKSEQCCCFTYQYIEKLKKFKGSSENGDLEEIADLEFLRTIDPDYLIIDWFFLF